MAIFVPLTIDGTTQIVHINMDQVAKITPHENKYTIITFGDKELGSLTVKENPSHIFELMQR